MLTKTESQKMNSFIKYFLNYITYLEKEMSQNTYNFNEIRILLELLEKERIYAKDIENDLDLDKGYTSRILKKMIDNGVLYREQSENDKRLFYVSLTPEGMELAKDLYKDYARAISKDYERFTKPEKKAFLNALEVIEKLHREKLLNKELPTTKK